jgi:hypothetical protein
MALFMGMPVWWLVEAALADRMRTALKAPAATLPDHKGTRIQPPTARWVCHYCVGRHVRFIPGPGRMRLHLSDAHQYLRQRLGKRYAWLYR